MDKLRLQFWTALQHFCALMAISSGILALLEYVGRTPNSLKNVLIPVTNLRYMRFLPPAVAQAWISLAVLMFSFAIAALAARRRKLLWHPSGFTTLPAPNGGYLRKANPGHLRKEFSKAPWKARLAAKRHFKKAEKCFKKNQYHGAAVEYRKSASEFATASAYLNEGICLCYTSLFRKAADAFDKGLSEALGRKNDAFASVVHGNIAIPYRELGSMEEARASFKEAYGICMSSGDSLGRLCALGNSGALFLARREPNEALQAWRDALVGLAEIRCNFARAVALDGVGRAYAAKKDVSRALSYHRKALRIFRSHRSVPGITGALANIGQAHARLGRRGRSLKVSRKALKLAVSYGSLLDQAAIYANMGLAHAKKNNGGDAIKSVEKALEIYKQIDNPLATARQLANIAVIYASQKKNKEALQKLEEARRCFQKAGDHMPECRSLEKRIRRVLRAGSGDGATGKSAAAQGEPMVFAEQA
jgi:tetratricopeptide (TPR) repeat protein